MQTDKGYKNVHVTVTVTLFIHCSHSTFCTIKTMFKLQPKSVYNNSDLFSSLIYI